MGLALAAEGRDFARSRYEEREAYPPPTESPPLHRVKMLADAHIEPPSLATSGFQSEAGKWDEKKGARMLLYLHHVEA